MVLRRRGSRQLRSMILLYMRGNPSRFFELLRVEVEVDVESEHLCFRGWEVEGW